MKKNKLSERKKIDYWTLIMSVLFPFFFLVMFLNEITYRNFYLENALFSGILMVFYPFLISIRQVINKHEDGYFFLNLYLFFFNKTLHNEDIGRIIAFYLTLMTNLIGIALIVYSLTR